MLALVLLLPALLEILRDPEKIPQSFRLRREAIPKMQQQQPAASSQLKQDPIGKRAPWLITRQEKRKTRIAPTWCQSSNLRVVCGGEKVQSKARQGRRSAKSRLAKVHDEEQKDDMAGESRSTSQARREPPNVVLEWMQEDTFCIACDGPSRPVLQMPLWEWVGSSFSYRRRRILSLLCEVMTCRVVQGAGLV